MNLHGVFSCELLYPVLPEKLEDIARDAIVELNKMGIVNDKLDITSVGVEILRSGFPMPTLKNNLFLNNKREEIKELKISNLIVVGALSEPNLFFQGDLLKDCSNKLNAI